MSTLERLEREYEIGIGDGEKDEDWDYSSIHYCKRLLYDAWPRIRDVLRAVERHETAMALWRKTVGMEHSDERVRMVDEAEHNIYEGREDMRVAWRKLEEEGGE